MPKKIQWPDGKVGCDTDENSCFEKGCLTNGEKLTQQYRKLLWVMVVFMVAWVNQVVLAWLKETAQTHVFVLSLNLLLNHLKPQSSKARHSLPLIPIGGVAYAFILFWDNLCRKSCLQRLSSIRILWHGLQASFHNGQVLHCVTLALSSVEELINYKHKVPHLFCLQWLGLLLFFYKNNNDKHEISPYCFISFA